MKILVVHNSYQQPGGEDAVFAGETQLLEDHGHTVVAYRRSNHELETMSAMQRLVMPVRQRDDSFGQQQARKFKSCCAMSGPTSFTCTTPS